MIKMAAATMAFLSLIACAPVRENELARHCSFGGNVAGVEYCRTTYIEILANPDLFDGQRVSLRVWAVMESGHILLFPFPEYVDAGFANSAIEFVLSGKESDDLKRLLSKTEPFEARKISISGRLEVVEGRKGEGGAVRFGHLHEMAGVGG